MKITGFITVLVILALAIIVVTASRRPGRKAKPVLNTKASVVPKPTPKAEMPPKPSESVGGVERGSSDGIRPLSSALALIAIFAFGYWALAANGLGQIAVFGLSHAVDQIFSAPSAMRARDARGSPEQQQTALGPPPPAAEEVQTAARVEREEFERKRITIPTFDYSDPPDPVTIPEGPIGYRINVGVEDGKEIQQLCSSHMFPKDAPAENFPCDGVTPVRVWQPRAVSQDQGQISVTVTFTHD
jgi:hypothetical protein